MTKTMSPKTEAALKTIALALITAPAGEMTEAQLEQLAGVGLPQIKALKDRGILALRIEGGWKHPELTDDIVLGGTYIYSIA
jgi:hypothetical protein